MERYHQKLLDENYNIPEYEEILNKIIEWSNVLERYLKGTVEGYEFNSEFFISNSTDIVEDETIVRNFIVKIKTNLKKVDEGDNLIEMVSHAFLDYIATIMFDFVKRNKKISSVIKLEAVGLKNMIDEEIDSRS